MEQNDTITQENLQNRRNYAVEEEREEANTRKRSRKVNKNVEIGQKPRQTLEVVTPER